MDTGSSGTFRGAAKRFASQLGVERRRCARSSSKASERGFTLAELLITVALLAILARMVIPNLNSSDADRLEVAVNEVREALRFARAEAMRTGQKILFDAESAPGRVKLLKLNLLGCNPFGGPVAVIDPRSKRAFDVDVTGGAYSGGVGVTPRFLAGGTPWGGVVFDASGAAIDACKVTGLMAGQGVPQAGSGMLLSLGDRQAAVTLEAATGRVSGP